MVQSRLTAPDESRAQARASGSATSTPQRKGKHNFVYWDTGRQHAAFLIWLPQELHDAPGINWTHLSPNVMRYCVLTIKDSPDAAVLAVVAASMRSIDQVSQQTALKQVNQLLRELRATGQVHILWQYTEHCVN